MSIREIVKMKTARTRMSMSLIGVASPRAHPYVLILTADLWRNFVKQMAYKVVEEVDGKLVSLYHAYLGEHTTEYSPDKPTDLDKICFVLDNLDHAIYLKSDGYNRQIWICEGKPAIADHPLRDRSERLGLWIDPYSSFMTDVRLLERIL